MIKPSYRDELMALRAATSNHVPHVELPASHSQEDPNMKQIKIFTPFRLATIFALLVVGCGSALALSPALQNFFLDFGAEADERAEQTQQQLDEQGIAGTATSTEAGDVYIQTDGANAKRLLELMERLTVVTPDGESTEVITGLKALSNKLGLPNADSVEIYLGAVPDGATVLPRKIHVDLGGEPSGEVVTGEKLRAALKAKGVADEIVELAVQKFEATYGKAAPPAVPHQ